MLRTNDLLRSIARFTVLPFTLLSLGCADDSTSPGDGAGGDGSGGNNGSAGDDGSGADGASGGTPGGGSDTTAPTVVSNTPDDEATGEAVNGTISATFSEAMLAGTLSGATFSLELDGVDVPGTVTYAGDTVSFSPDDELELDATYTATITTEATDLGGNALEESHVWTFTTDSVAPRGPAPVLLGAAGHYAILAKSAVSNVPTSAVTGNIGLSPAAASYITGFSLTRAGQKWTTPQVVGGVFAADGDPPTPRDLTTAVSDMQTAYTDAAGRPTPQFLEHEGGNLGGLTLAPGLYKWTSAVTVPADVTLAGAANDVWIFQLSGDLKMSAAQKMILSGGARAKNIFWQVAGVVELGTTAHAEGIVLSKTAIKLGAGASINGRLLAQTAVNLASSTVTAP